MIDRSRTVQASIGNDPLRCHTEAYPTHSRNGGTVGNQELPKRKRLHKAELPQDQDLLKHDDDPEEGSTASKVTWLTFP